MFINRLMVEGASLVCSVDSTRWPVSAALTAISAVSKSRISPTRMMLGSWRRKARSAEAKLSPICSFIWTWLMPASWNSTGSSAVMMLVSGGVQAGHGGIQGVRLARAGGAGDQHHSVRLQNLPLELGQRLRLEAELRHVQAQILFVEQPENDFFAEQRGDGGNAEIELFLLLVLHVLDHDAAVLREPLFADVELGHDLHAAGDGVLQLHGRRHHVLQNAVNAEAHAIFLFVRLDVDIAGAALHGVGEDQVAELDDGGFFGGLLEARQIHLGLFGGQFEGFVFRR